LLILRFAAKQKSLQSLMRELRVAATITRFLKCVSLAPNFPAPRPVPSLLTGRGGEPLPTMTADTITVERIDSLRIRLSLATASMSDLWLAFDEGEIDPSEAAAIVNETITNLTNEAR